MNSVLLLVLSLVSTQLYLEAEAPNCRSISQKDAPSVQRSEEWESLEDMERKLKLYAPSSETGMWFNGDEPPSEPIVDGSIMYASGFTVCDHDPSKATIVMQDLEGGIYYFVNVQKPEKGVRTLNDVYIKRQLEELLRADGVRFVGVREQKDGSRFLRVISGKLAALWDANAVALSQSLISIKVPEAVISRG